MCAINGSTNIDKAYKLYINSLDRGSFASGFLAYTKTHFIVLKQKEVFELDYLKEQFKRLNEFGMYYLFHSRAPTNTTSQVFNYNTTHPFSCKQWFVAQNGIIQNFRDFPNSLTFTVDSSIIPYHLAQHNGDIAKVYSKYKGLLTSWIYDTENLYVVKAGSSLHMDSDSFSSVAFEGSTSVEKDGLILRFDGLKFNEVGTFDYKNPYYIF